MKSLEDQLEELKVLIVEGDFTHESISKSGTFWHIDHALRVIRAVIKRLQETKANDYKFSFNLNRTYVFAINGIPRGVGRAPKGVVNNSPITEESLYEQILKTKNTLEEVALIESNQYFEHPYFSHLKKKKAIRFIQIHTEHHLKIIRDIINQN